MATLVLRLVLAPAFIVAITLAARRFGARAGGVVGGLPVIAGPILLVLTLDKGREFAADAAAGTLLGVVALIAFVFAYVAASARFGWAVSMVTGWAAFFGVVALLRPVHAGPVLALVLACGACAAGLVALPRPQPGEHVHEAHPRYDLTFRAACAVVPVVVITGLAGVFGAHVSGLLASFPIITPVVAAFTQAQRGRHEAVLLLYGFTGGFVAYSLFCFVVAAGLERLGTPGTFALGAAVALAAQAAAVGLTHLDAR